MGWLFLVSHELLRRISEFRLFEGAMEKNKKKFSEFENTYPVSKRLEQRCEKQKLNVFN